jgi:anti-sigma28 factor (negative regulator of flagellin synthesis)
MLSSLDQTDEVRTEKVAQLREAIADGSYVTEEKIAITPERLIEALRALAVG